MSKTVRFTIDAIGRIPDGNTNGMSIIEYAIAVANGVDLQPCAMYPIITGTYTIPTTAWSKLESYLNDHHPNMPIEHRVPWCIFAWVSDTWLLDNLQVEKYSYALIDQ
jgi:hypothetical protein